MIAAAVGARTLRWGHVTYQIAGPRTIAIRNPPHGPSHLPRRSPRQPLPAPDRDRRTPRCEPLPLSPGQAPGPALLVYRLPPARLALANDLNIVETVPRDRAGPSPRALCSNRCCAPSSGPAFSASPAETRSGRRGDLCPRPDPPDRRRHRPGPQGPDPGIPGRLAGRGVRSHPERAVASDHRHRQPGHPGYPLHP